MRGRIYLWINVIIIVVFIISAAFNIYFISHKERVNSTLYSENSINADSTEEYVWVATMTDNQMYINNDQKALKEFGKEMGVKVTIEGPKQYDVPGQIVAMEEVIKRKPAGIMVLGMETSLIPVVNKAIDAGIPTITVDADLVGSKRLAHVGSNWYDIGVKQAEAVVKLLGGKGKVAIMGIFGADNMQAGFQGFKSVIMDYKDITLVGEYDDMANVQESKRITLEILKEHPDIAAICGFDSNSGPGIGEAIKEADKIGKVKVTCVDMEPEHIKLLKQGIVQKLIGQKRKLFTYYGAKLLYDLNHSKLRITPDDAYNRVTNIPNIVDTGLIEIDSTNVDSIIDKMK
ncbi:MAG: periplasmic binding protein/LacI transcriptional regulator [Clostridia bacterium]|jgi:ABC-type sugar transport system substrate-binding protein|nr:periplasmic binding protein/LacI transcriptional regulator [Clostridia bacterium]